MKSKTYLKNYIKNNFLPLLGESRRSKIINWIFTRPLYKYYNLTNPCVVNDRKTIIYKSDEKASLWGLCDRLRGIVSVYKYCKDNNFDFKIYFVHPFKLYDFLIPNLYDWIIEEKNISYNSKDSKPLCIVFLTENEKVEKKIAFDALSTEFKQLHVYTNIWIGDDSFKDCFNELFKPTQELQDKINWNKEQIGEKYIAVQFRFLELLGDLKECMDTSHLKNEEEKQKLLASSLRAVHMIKQTNIQYKKILLASDSITFVNRVKEIEGIYVVPGVIGHSGVVSSKDANMKTFLDLFMLANAQKIYSVVIPPMRNSKYGFAERASKINNIPFEQIIFND